MKLLFKQFALILVLAAFAMGMAHAGPVGTPVAASIKLQGGSDSSADWYAPSTSAYKVYVFVPKTGGITNALYRVYPNGKRLGSTECLSTYVQFPCYEVTVDQTQHQNTWTQLTLNDDPATQWYFRRGKGKGYVSAVASNLSAAERLNLSGLVRFENPALDNTYQGGLIKLQGGGRSRADWYAPSTSAYKVHVFVPKTGAVTNALYRIYPNGKRLGSTECLATDAQYPCYAVTVDQTQHQNTWTQLTLDNDPETQWYFAQGKRKGYVSAVASNLSAAELLNLSSVVRFENLAIAIGKTYQGGLIFYVDNTGEHGLIAAPTDQSTGIQWYNGTFLITGATATAVGTGQANTNKIINAQGSGAYAAKLTADLVLGGYDDWFLPSRDELGLMYKNIGKGAAAPLTNVGGFSTVSWYWSSSEVAAGGAWFQTFASGGYQYEHGVNTDLPFYVRAVRAF